MPFRSPIARAPQGGGIVAVLSGQLSIAAFSPRLDAHDHSVAVFQACMRLSNKLELHAMHVARAARSAIRDSYDSLEHPSPLPMVDRRILEQHGGRATIDSVRRLIDRPEIGLFR